MSHHRKHPKEGTKVRMRIVGRDKAVPFQIIQWREHPSEAWCQVDLLLLDDLAEAKGRRVFPIYHSAFEDALVGLGVKK